MQLEIEFDTAVNKQPHRKPASTHAGMVTLDRKVTGRAQSPLEKRFHRLWQQLEEKQQRNGSFESAFEKTNTYIRTELNENRVAYRTALVQQTEKLIGHLKKKSLAQWQRAELKDWIEQNFSLLEMYGAQELRELSALYVEASMAQFTDTEKSIIENELNMSIEEFAAAIKELDDDDDDEWDAEFEFDELFDEEPAKDDARYTHQERSAEADTDRQQEIQREQESRAHFDKTILNKLFRRTAKALHPDHESDPDIRDQKQTLMKVLLEARKTGDIATIFTLYREHVSTEALEIEAPALKPMIKLLQHQIDTLDQQYNELICRTPTHQWVHDYIIGKSEQQQKKALLAIKQDIEADLENIKATGPHLKSLAKLKPLLEARWDQSRFSYYGI